MSKVSQLRNKSCGGVAIIPIHQYYNPGHANHGKICVVLGMEVAGANRGKWNFIGGSASDHGGNAWATMLAESEEELGLPLHAGLLEKCIIRTVTYSRTEFVGVHITGLSSRRWDEMYAKRRSMRLEHRFLEMTAIASIPIGDLDKRSDISDYVRTYIGIVRGLASRKPGSPTIYNTEGVHYSQFVSITRPLNRGVPMLN